MTRLPQLVVAVVLVAAAESAVTIDSIVAALRTGTAVEIAGERMCATQPIPLFYSRRDNRPAWSARDEAALVNAIREAAEDGLNPADYHLAAIAALHRDAARSAERDVVLTDAFFLLGSHLLSGRVNPETIEPTWCLEPRTSDLVPALETALENHDVGATIDRFRCTRPGYCQLRDHLARYRTLPPWQPIDSGPKLRLGNSGARVEQLVARLTASGELSGAHPQFDAAVGAAVQRFQRLHGLDVDGVVGSETLRELNVSREQRIRQIELNLERWRWLPADLGARHAIINIPEFQLSVVEGDKTVLTMRIVVGKDFTHRTPVFSSEIKEIVFSPYWNVPDSIAAKELWPKQRADASYFAREHIEVLPGGGLRQKPGPWNSLGLIKFNLPNRYSVYLHDTPARTLFSRSVRTFSHGCMRIEKPVDLAAYLLPGWTRGQIVTESEKGAEHAVQVKKPLPVHVLYWTAFVDEAGDLHFAPDVYGRDVVLDEAMRRR